MQGKIDRRRLLVSVGVAVVVLVAGAAWALAQSEGVINACVNESDGTLRIVADPVCRNKEILLSWNIMGPPGPQGEQGMPGAQGDPGLACWDVNKDGVQDAAEDINGDGLWDTADCKGPQGEPGMQGETGATGETGPQGEQGPAGPQGPAGVVERPGFSLSVAGSILDSTETSNTSIMIGADGLPVIAYEDQKAYQLRVVHCNDLGCTSATETHVVGEVLSTNRPSLAIGAGGLPLIVSGETGPYVTHCNDLACTTASSARLADNQFDASITIGADGLPVITAGGRLNFLPQLLVVHCGDAACTQSTASWLDPGPRVSANKLFTSIAIGEDGLPVVSYYDGYTQDLKVAHCAEVACTTATITTLDSDGNVGRSTSIAIGADGLPVISYADSTDGALKVAHCADVACATAAITALDFGYYVASTSITMGADGLPVISYELLPDASHSTLRVAHCSDRACSSAALTTVDASAQWVGSRTSITIGPDGLPVISYFDASNWTLKVAHCSNAFCTPWVRRR